MPECPDATDTKVLYGHTKVTQVLLLGAWSFSSSSRGDAQGRKGKRHGVTQCDIARWSSVEFLTFELREGILF